MPAVPDRSPSTEDAISYLKALLATDGECNRDDLKKLLELSLKLGDEELSQLVKKRQARDSDSSHGRHPDS